MITGKKQTHPPSLSCSLVLIIGRHVIGTKNNSNTSIATPFKGPQSERNSPQPDTDSSKWESEQGSETGSLLDATAELESLQVVARISTHILREERAFSITKSLIKNVDPEGRHIVRPIDIVRLNALQGDKGSLIVCIFEYPGSLNYLSKVIDYGPAWYRSRKNGDKLESYHNNFQPTKVVDLQSFLDFAIGATECIEILHHGQRIVHGEIRADAFHMNEETRRVKLISFGSGLRTFEHGLTSVGWSALSKEIGAKTKLSYMSPEQTGRMPAEPDSRTDIYSLGILFWTLLVQQPAFDGQTPMDIIQGVLGRRLPPVSSMRMDVPDVISRIIQKMTAKTIHERYHSASGLRHDLVEIQKLIGAGESATLEHWKISTKDVSSFFILPATMIGREAEKLEVVKIIDKVSRQHLIGQMQDSYTTTSSGSNLSDAHLETFNAAIAGPIDLSSEGDNTSSAEMSQFAGKATSLSVPYASDHRKSFLSTSSQLNKSSGANSIHSSMESHESSMSNHSISHLQALQKNSGLSSSSKSMADSMLEASEQPSGSDGVGSLASDRNKQKFRRKGRCEVVSISGSAGLGKSCLVQSIQLDGKAYFYIYFSFSFKLATSL
jgi:serine/threonine protein kinase